MMFHEFFTMVVPNEIECHLFLVEKGLLKSAENNVPCHKYRQNDGNAVMGSRC